VWYKLSAREEFNYCQERKCLKEKAELPAGRKPILKGKFKFHQKTILKDQLELFFKETV
jgi:hypothetical protein